MRQNTTASPNVLFIMTDQHRYDCLGCNGNLIVKTPYIDRLAVEGANFSSFFVQSPVCVPSRQTFFSGRYPHSHKNRVNYTAMHDDLKLMQRYYRELGYRTAFAGKLHYFPPSREYALTTGFDDGCIHDAGPTDKYSDYVSWLKEHGRYPQDGNYRKCRGDDPNPFSTVLPDEYHETTWCGLKTRELLRDLAGRDQPFFLFSSYWKPHSSFEIPEPWASMYKDAKISLPKRMPRDYFDKIPAALRSFALRNGWRHFDMSDESIAWEYRAYYGAISQIDHEVGLTLKVLDELGLQDNTIVVFCSDHGDVMHEHGMVDKNTFFESSIHVPFIIRYPGIVQPGVYDQLVESTDVLSTLLSLSGGQIPWADEGRPFSSLIAPGIDGPEYLERDCVFAENIIPEVIADAHNPFEFIRGEGIKGIRHPDAKMVRTRRWKYNYYAGEEELYDLETDPEELHNRAHEPGCAAIKTELKNRLLDWMITSDENSQIAPRWFVVRDERGEWSVIS